MSSTAELRWLLLANAELKLHRVGFWRLAILALSRNRVMDTSERLVFAVGAIAMSFAQLRLIANV